MNGCFVDSNGIDLGWCILDDLEIKFINIQSLNKLNWFLFDK